VLWSAVAIVAIGIAVACSHEATGPNSQGITDIVMTPDTLNLAIGDTATVQAQPVTASGSHVSGQTLFWSTSDPTIATVTQTGKVTAVAVGAVNIDASTAGVSPTHPARVFVVSVPVSKVIVAPPSVTLRVGDAFQFTDTTKDASGNVLTGRTVVWSSSDTAIAPVDQAGLVLAKALGTVTITASSGKASGTGSVTVSLVPVKKIVIAPSNPSVIVHDSTQLSATTQDSAGNVLTGRAITWSSSNSAISTVDANGVVTGVKVGVDTITATSGAASAAVTFTVQSVPINAVVISPQSSNLLVGQQQTLTAEVTDNSGNPIAGSTVTFASGTPGVATVTATGPLTATVTAIGSGQATITGTSGTKSGTATINVAIVPVASVTVTPTPDTVTLGGTVQLTATLKDSAGNTLTGRTVTWQSGNTGVATVSASGLVTSVGVGTAAIIATSGGKTGLAEVTVNQVPVGSVTITPQNDTVSVGAQKQLAVTVVDANGHTISNPAVTWSSTNNGTAIVSSTGLGQGVSTGTVQIIAASGGKADTNTTLVVPATVATVNVSIGASTIAVGGTTVVTATSKDGTGNVLPGRSVTWSSGGTGTASVSAGGVDPTTQLDTATVTGVAIGGPVSITATSSTNVQGSAQVTVATAINHINLSPNQFTINTHATRAVTATAFDVNNHAIGGVVFAWTTKSSGAIASVDQTGLVTGVGPGSDSVYASAQGITGGAGVTVNQVPAATVIIVPGSSTMPNNSSLQLGDTVKDAAGDTLLNRTVTWKSSDNTIATVSAAGLVQPGTANPDTGTVTITATSGSANGTATVHVVYPTVTNVSVTPSPDTIYATSPNNGPVNLTATTTPAGVPVAWSNNNTAVATVSGTGVVTPTGTAAGTATITATSPPGGTATGTATVVVLGHIQTVNVNPGTSSLSVSGLVQPTSTTATAQLIDSFGTDVSSQRMVTWATSDPTSVTISTAGPVLATTPITLTAIANNSLTVTITATSSDGMTGTTTITVLP
jgi:trimeric autotransporter adhesin